MTTGAWDITNWDQSTWGVAAAGRVPLFQDYQSLINGIQDTLKDSGVTVENIRNFIDIAHLKIERDLLSGQSIPRQMLMRGTNKTDANSAVGLPEGFMKARSVTLNTIVCRYMPPEKIWSQTQGYADGDVTLDFYQRIPQLSDSVTSNWLLEMAGDVYLWGACLQYVPWGHEHDVLQLWKGFYDDALLGLRRTNGAQPRGGFIRRKGLPYGAGYTIIENGMLFGHAQ